MRRNHPNFPGSGQAHQHSVCDLTDALERSQLDIEQEKVVLVRLLHHDLGGLLVGAIIVGT